jgi:hypothetical protein
VETNRKPAVFVPHGIDHIHLRIKREAVMTEAPTLVSQPPVIMFKDGDGSAISIPTSATIDICRRSALRSRRISVNNVKRAR